MFMEGVLKYCYKYKYEKVGRKSSRNHPHFQWIGHHMYTP